MRIPVFELVIYDLKIHSSLLNLSKSRDTIIWEHKDCKILPTDETQARERLFLGFSFLSFFFPPTKSSRFCPFKDLRLFYSIPDSVTHPGFWGADTKEEWRWAHHPRRISLTLSMKRMIVVWIFFSQFVLQSIESLMIRMGLRRERESQKE